MCAAAAPPIRLPIPNPNPNRRTHPNPNPIFNPNRNHKPNWKFFLFGTRISMTSYACASAVARRSFVNTDKCRLDAPAA